MEVGGEAGKKHLGQVDLECRYEGCEKICESKTGLTSKERRMHMATEMRERFRCGRYGRNSNPERAHQNRNNTSVWVRGIGGKLRSVKDVGGYYPRLIRLGTRGVAGSGTLKGSLAHDEGR